MILLLHLWAVILLQHYFLFCPGAKCHSGFQRFKILGWEMELNRGANTDFLNWFCGLWVITHLVETSRLGNKLSGALFPDTFYRSIFLIITKSMFFSLRLMLFHESLNLMSYYQVQPCCESVRTLQKVRLHISGHLMLRAWMKRMSIRSWTLMDFWAMWEKHAKVIFLSLETQAGTKIPQCKT